MNVAVNLWRLIQEDRLVRYAAFATAAVLWFAIAWADIMILLVGMSMVGDGAHAHHAAAAAATSAGVALFATGLHAVSYLAVTAFIALLVFDKLGVGVLRRAWFNLDVLWSGALVATGAATLMM